MTSRAVSDGDRETGSALLAVIGVLAVTVVVSLTIAGATMNSLTTSSTTRAGVQSQAAAQAGIAYATARLSSGHCSPTYTATDNPAFTASVQYSLGAAGDSWIPGCPGSVVAARIRIVSTGAAASPGVSGDALGDARTIESVYAAAAAPSPITASGPAVYSYGSSGVGTTGRLLSVAGSRPDLMVKNGDVDCGTSGEVNGNVVVANGVLTAGTSCVIAGDVWSSGKTTLGTSFTMAGNVVASTVAMGTSSRVGGSVWSTGKTTLDASAVIGGGLTAGALGMGTSSQIAGSAWVTGAADLGTSSRIAGRLTAVSKSGTGTASGGITLLASPGPGPAPAAAPLVPGWIDFSYNTADWPGFVETRITGTCDLAALQVVTTRMTGPGIIDARSCTAGVTLGTSAVLALPQDLVIVANRFDLGTSAGFSSSVDRKLWLVTPDTVRDGVPTCPPSGAFAIGTSANVGARIRALAYTPCGLTAGTSVTWYGQFYAGTVALSTSAALNYSPVGLPGVDLSQGTDAPPATANLLSDLRSIRDVGTQ